MTPGVTATIPRGRPAGGPSRGQRSAAARPDPAARLERQGPGPILGRVARLPVPGLRAYHWHSPEWSANPFTPCR